MESDSDCSVATGMEKMALDDAAQGSEGPAASGAASAGRKQRGKPKKEEQRAKPKKPGDDGYVAGWPDALACETCDREDRHHWKALHREWVATDEHSGFYQRVCKFCIMARHNLNEAEARVWIVQANPATAKRKDRDEEYRKVRDENRQEHPMMSKSGIRKLVHNKLLQQVFRPLADLLVRKKKWLDARAEMMKDRVALLDKFKKETNPRLQYSYMLELEAWETNYEKLYGRPLAWNTLPPEKQSQMFAAADYEDTWVTGKGGSFKAWYFCNADIGWKGNGCKTFISAKAWDKLHKGADEWEKTGQRWWCNCCGARYMTRHGMMCEVYHPHTGTFWVRAKVPNLDHQDVRAMRIERDMAGRDEIVDAAALFASLPDTLPSSVPVYMRAAIAADMRDGRSPEGHWKLLNEEVLANIPWFEWDTLFNLFGLKIPEKVEKKGGKKKRGKR